MSKLRGRAINVLKWGLAALMLWLLARSGKLSMKDVQTFFSNPAAAFGSMAIVTLVYLAAFFRWSRLLCSQGIRIRYSRVFQLGMLGQFFSTVMPGTVGGDLVKAIYIARRFPDHKVRVISTILVDRISGLAGMMILGATAFLVGRGHFPVGSSSALRLVEGLGWVLVAVASVILLALALLPVIGKRLPDELPESWGRKLPFAQTLGSLYLAGKAYHTQSRYLWSSVGLSVLMHCMNVAVLFIVAHAVFGPLPWGTIDPSLFVLGSVLGMAAQSIPLAPMGLGVGQVAFAGVFYALGAPSEGFGAALVTGLQLVGVILNLTGSIFFATYRHEVHDAVELAS